LAGGAHLAKSAYDPKPISASYGGQCPERAKQFGGIAPGAKIADNDRPALVVDKILDRQMPHAAQRVPIPKFIVDPSHPLE
jgi:hypothetical protein